MIPEGHSAYMSKSADNAIAKEIRLIVHKTQQK